MSTNTTPRPVFKAMGVVVELPRPRRPIERMSVARLVACETCMDRLMSKAAMHGDKHATETIKALQLYTSAQKLLTRDV